jgi:hypothetical protein
MCYDVHPDKREEYDRHGRIARAAFLWAGIGLWVVLVLLNVGDTPCLPMQLR